MVLGSPWQPRAQRGLAMEYTVNYIGIPYRILGFSIILGSPGGFIYFPISDKMNVRPSSGAGSVAGGRPRLGQLLRRLGGAQGCLLKEALPGPPTTNTMAISTLVGFVWPFFGVSIYRITSQKAFSLSPVQLWQMKTLRNSTFEVRAVEDSV